VQTGKVRAIGTSNHSAEQVAEALAVSEREGLAAYATLQPHYNLYSRATFEGPLQDLAVEKGLGVITYFSLESGFLTGKYKTADQIVGAKREDMLKGKFDERGVRILAVLDAVAQRNEATPAQVALAWLLAQPGVTAPIVSATTIEQLADTLKAATLELSAEDVAELTEASVY
jgi:aryl-alcohol dehydrogenase-like predicted oxidoreductase